MAEVKLPRVAITYCTQCRWMLRAAYFGQELLSTFGTTIGEIALIPATGGLFQVNLTYDPSAVGGSKDSDATEPSAANDDSRVEVKSVLLWDRKAEGGFPETKVLKQLVRDHLEPNRDLGHSDKHGKGGSKTKEEPAGAEPRKEEPSAAGTEKKEVKRNADGSVCEDCR